MFLLFLLACSCCCSFHVWVSTIAIGTTSFLGEWLLLASFFVVCCLLLFDSTLQSSGPARAVGPYLQGSGPAPAVGFLFAACSCLPRVCNVGMLHLQLDLWLHFFVVEFA
jgi:hypothetical protein